MRRHWWRLARLITLGLVVALCATLAPSSTVKPGAFALIKLKQAQSVDTTPDVTWILAVGSDARPGEEFTHTRGDALHLIGINSKTGGAADIGRAAGDFGDRAPVKDDQKAQHQSEAM